MNETQQQLPWWLPDPIIVFFIGFLALMYFMTIRPQQKRMKALQEMMDGLEKGDEVVAAGELLVELKKLKVLMFPLKSVKILLLNFKKLLSRIHYRKVPSHLLTKQRT